MERRIETSFTELRGRLAELGKLQSGLHLDLRADIRELRNLVVELRAR